MSRPAPVRTEMTFEQYLEFEKASPVKHEFVDHQLFAMAGASERHNALAFRLATLAASAAQGGGCRVVISDLKLKTPGGQSYYPDVMGLCDDADDDPYVKRNPCFIAEVLSESTEAIDRGEKLQNYSRISTLQTYVLLSQVEAKAEVYSRQPDGSLRYELLEADDLLILPCVGLQVSVEELYPRP